MTTAAATTCPRCYSPLLPARDGYACLVCSLPPVRRTGTGQRVHSGPAGRLGDAQYGSAAMAKPLRGGGERQRPYAPRVSKPDRVAHERPWFLPPREQRSGTNPL